MQNAESIFVVVRSALMNTAVFANLHDIDNTIAARFEGAAAMVAAMV